MCVPPDAVGKLSGGPHLLAPTGSDLAKLGAVGTVLAGFHHDLNFIMVMLGCALVVGGWVCRFCRGGGALEAGGGGCWGVCDPGLCQRR